jgi:hypothetical protein
MNRTKMSSVSDSRPFDQTSPSRESSRGTSTDATMNSKLRRSILHGCISGTHALPPTTRGRSTAHIHSVHGLFALKSTSRHRVKLHDVQSGRVIYRTRRTSCNPVHEWTSPIKHHRSVVLPGSREATMQEIATLMGYDVFVRCREVRSQYCHELHGRMPRRPPRA